MALSRKSKCIQDILVGGSNIYRKEKGESRIFQEQGERGAQDEDVECPGPKACLPRRCPVPILPTKTSLLSCKGGSWLPSPSRSPFVIHHSLPMGPHASPAASSLSTGEQEDVVFSVQCRCPRKGPLALGLQWLGQHFAQFVSQIRTPDYSTLASQPEALSRLWLLSLRQDGLFCDSVTEHCIQILSDTTNDIHITAFPAYSGSTRKTETIVKIQNFLLRNSTSAMSQ